MRRIAITLLVPLLPCVLLAQRPVQNIRRVVVTSQYEIKEGKRTGTSMAIRQEIKDSLGRVHTIFNRDYSTQRVVSHTWHMFNGNQIVRTDEFVNEQLRYYRLFSYSADSLVDTETIYMVSPGDTTLYAKLTYRYRNRKPVRISAVSPRGKRAYSVRSVFDARGTEVSRRVKTRKFYAPLDSIVEQTVMPLYDSLGRVSSETIRVRRVGQRVQTRHFSYTYNGEGLLSDIEELDSNGERIYKKTLEYNNQRMLKFISVYNSRNELTEFYAKRYELYPTNNRRNQIIEY